MIKKFIIFDLIKRKKIQLNIKVFFLRLLKIFHHIKKEDSTKYEEKLQSSNLLLV
jgi:hypothetical protein